MGECLVPAWVPILSICLCIKHDDCHHAREPYVSGQYWASNIVNLRQTLDIAQKAVTSPLYLLIIILVFHYPLTLNLVLDQNKFSSSLKVLSGRLLES